jgi:hypothetical protein
MRQDYDRIRGWINPNEPANHNAPQDTVSKSKPLRDNYDTIYQKDYLQKSAPAKQQSYKPEQQVYSTAPFFANTTYKDMTMSTQKPGYSPIKPAREQAKPISKFDEKTIYQKDYKGKELKPVYKDEMGATNKEIFGGTTNMLGAGPMNDKTVYRDDYTGHKPESNNFYKVDPFMQTSLPKPKYFEDKTTYMKDYVPKQNKTR